MQPVQFRSSSEVPVNFSQNPIMFTDQFHQVPTVIVPAVSAPDLESLRYQYFESLGQIYQLHNRSTSLEFRATSLESLERETREEVIRLGKKLDKVESEFSSKQGGITGFIIDLKKKEEDHKREIQRLSKEVETLARQVGWLNRENKRLDKRPKDA